MAFAHVQQNRNKTAVEQLETGSDCFNLTTVYHRRDAWRYQTSEEIVFCCTVRIIL